MSRTRAYRNGKLEAHDFPVSEVSEYLGEPDVVVWVDLCAPSEDEFGELVDELGFHELAVEDALSAHQRPKLDHYSNHLFLSCHAVDVDVDDGTLEATEIDAFINARWLVTVRKSEDFPLDKVLERWDRSSDLGRFGVPYLLYGLVDVVIDGYFETVQGFDEFYDQVSESIFDEKPIEPSRQRHWFEMRRALVQFHRLVVPLREVVSALMRREHTLIPDELYPYYQDLYDHILRVTESTDSLRDVVSTIVETNISLRDYRQNQIMKKVTSWAAIIAVPTLVTGYYGMNVPFPGFARHWGVHMASGLVIILSLTLYTVFKRKEWL